MPTKPSRVSHTTLAKTIGYAVIAWSELEATIDRLLSALAFPDREIQADAFMLVLDVKQKLPLLKTFTFMRTGGADCYSFLEGLLNKIDNELRVERNRIMHDW